MKTIEKRAVLRLRTRLRPGKILAEDGRFLGDCAIVDRSADGARVRLFETGGPLPDAVELFDERESTRRPARLAWLSGFEAGLSFAAPCETVAPADAERIAGRYYAVGR